LLHDIGYVASGTASAYESMVVMDELVGWVKAYLDGVTIDTEALAVDEIAAVGPGGTHLARKYTRQHVRDYMMPKLISQDQYDAWAAAGGSTLLQRTAQKTKDLRESARAYELEPGALRQLDELVEKARRERDGV
jgi:trimethylamine--corrinoid protein Co-methyltransferase